MKIDKLNTLNSFKIGKNDIQNPSSWSRIPNQQTYKNEKINYKPTAIAAIGVGIIGALIAILRIIKIRGANINSSAAISSYKRELLKALGLDSSKLSCLNSIVEKNEFLKFLKEIQTTPSIFEAGEGLKGVMNKTFGANLHIHTTNSDGQMSIARLLDIASKYANKYFIKNNKPFFVAITDHDTTAGCKEALKIISQNPDKFKNLRVILGCEITTNFKNVFSKFPKKVDLLAYCVNPFDNNISILNRNNLLFQQDSIKSVINNANLKFHDILAKNGFEYKYDDFAKIRPSINTTTGSIALSMKDFMQFRLIYANLVEKNPQMLKLLEKNGISLCNLDFSEPKRMVMNGKMSKSPFWQNYVDEILNYLQIKLKETNPEVNIDELSSAFKNIDSDIYPILDTIERIVPDSKSDLFVKTVEKLDFDYVVKAFSKDKNLIVGIPHPCVTASEEIGNPKAYDLMDDLFCRFKKLSQQDENIYEGYYQSYWSIVNETQKRKVDEIATKYGFLKTGGLDSHFNNIFTDQKSLTNEQITDILA